MTTANETIAQAQRHTSAALQMLRIACDYLDNGNLGVGRDMAKDARAELYLAYEAMGGYGHLDATPTDAERLKAGQPVTCALCGRQVTGDDRAATPGDDGRVICGACNAGIR